MASITLSMDGTLLNWIKNVGDAVKQGEVVAEVESDKATVEVEAPADGVLSSQAAKPGDELKEGAVIGEIGAAGAAPASAPSNGAASQPAPAPAPAAPQPTQAAPTAPSIDQFQRSKPVDRGEPPTLPEAEEDGSLPDGVKASPIARHMAEERGIDLRQVRGTGPGGRIVKADIDAFVPGAAPAPAPAQPTAPAQPAPAAAQGQGLGMVIRPLPQGDNFELLDVNTMRKRIAAVTVESKQQHPHFYVTIEVDAAPMLELREELNASLAEGATKISVNDMIVKATALTLRQFPNLNSHFYGDKIARYKDINIGIAVALPNNGLINVVAHNADKVSLGTLAQSNKEMFARAREGKIKPDDIRGATFTTSNLGIYDVDHFLAIISPPEAAILAVGTAKKVPVVLEDGTLGVGNRMKLTVSVDHRVSDGAEGAQFLKALKDILEHPMRLLI
jgi:pyruvate dehydrogenase E2 component (dihydrolipoamide acetyltransferase)